MNWKYAKRVDVNQSDIVGILRARGFQVRIIGRPFDLLVARNGKMCFAEVKDPKKEGWASEFTTQQKKFLEDWAGPEIVVLRTDNDALTMELK